MASTKEARRDENRHFWLQECNSSRNKGNQTLIRGGMEGRGIPVALEQSHGHMPCLCLGCLGDSWEMAVTFRKRERDAAKLQQVAAGW